MTRAAAAVVAEVLEHRVLLAIAPIGPEVRVNESTLPDHATTESPSASIASAG